MVLLTTNATTTTNNNNKDTPLKVPPSGTGDCAAIKLFQHAFSKGYSPIALAEFWWGPSPESSGSSDNDNDDTATATADTVARMHGNYYPCCRGKCEPILTRHMLVGTNVHDNPLLEQGANAKGNVGESSSQLSSGSSESNREELSIVYEDDWLVVVNKPHNVLSVPGKMVQDSIKTSLQQCYPEATGPILVHRLDYSTSGLLLATKDSNTHQLLQAQFINRTVKKRYIALLEGDVLLRSNGSNSKNKGTIDLPLAGDYLHRPMQKVERGPKGKHAVTHYEVIGTTTDGAAALVQNAPTTTGTNTNPTRKQEQQITRTRIYFYPQTGRTHQLRVHASHPEGLGMAIVGDDIYGKRDKRLCLHADLLEITHPYTNKKIVFRATPCPF